DTGRIFYSMAMGGMGLQAIYYHSFPYYLLPPLFPGKTAMVILTLIGGIIFVSTGACLVIGKKVRQVSLLFGGMLLLIFCFYFVPYELFVSHNYLSPGEWENAEKELALAGGALTIAGCFPGQGKTRIMLFLNKLVPFGAILFAITIACFGILHFVYAKQASGYIPSWIP